MLFPLTSEQPRLRVIGLGGNVSNPGGTISTNKDDVTNISGTSVTSFDLRDVSRRTIMQVGSVHSTSSSFNSGVVCVSPSPVSNSSSNVITYRSGGSAEGFFNALCLCVDTAETARVPRTAVVGQKRQGGAFIAGRISAAGAVSYGKGDFSCSKTATGTYQITFLRRNFGAVPLCIVQPRIAVSTALYGSRVDSLTTSGCTVYIANAGTPSLNTSVDAEFDILLYGFAARDSYGRARAPLGATRRKGRIEIHRIETQAHMFGASVATLTAGGSGQYTLAHRRSYAYPPHIFMCANSNRVANAINTSTSSSSVIYSHAIDSEGAADAAQLNCLIVGFDDASEY